MFVHSFHNCTMWNVNGKETGCGVEFSVLPSQLFCKSKMIQKKKFITKNFKNQNLATVLIRPHVQVME